MENTTREVLTWHKSSYSGGDGGNCLEAALTHPTLIRDSKAPHGPRLTFRPEAWAAFVEHLISNRM
ncbi:DUF397 domain-containing protein [Streptomyces sp. DSM 15324]|uniref:DUF397 domain-containing protein n=1 Tax=Streptomyces sp. DSM 15324 TaxID=1739111 RepID=UPI0007486847|nr:DUF397 domain-containing protein [Streptomyces sp. DSM 15324]KUO10477.1 hypothetical protein AQJ58_18910 [Streptomyces sp. DSM 15324]